MVRGLRAYRLENKGLRGFMLIMLGIRGEGPRGFLFNGLRVRG